MARPLSFIILGVFIAFSYTDARALSDEDHNQFLKNSPAYAAADRRLNEVWLDLRDKLPKEEYSSLLEEQRSWVKDGRDKEATEFGGGQPDANAYALTIMMRVDVLLQRYGIQQVQPPELADASRQQAQLEAQQLRAEAAQQAQLEAQRQAEAEQQAQLEAQLRAEAAQQAQLEAQRQAEAVQQAQLEAQLRAEAAQQAQLEAQRQAEAEQQTQLEAQLRAEAAQQAQLEAQRQADTSILAQEQQTQQRNAQRSTIYAVTMLNAALLMFGATFLVYRKLA